MSYDEVLNRRSYLTLILLNRAIPGIKPFDEQGKETGGVPTTEQEDELAQIAKHVEQQQQRAKTAVIATPPKHGRRYNNMDELFMSLM